MRMISQKAETQTRVHEAYRGPFLQHLSNGETQIIVDTTPNECDDIDSFKHIVHDTYTS